MSALNELWVVMKHKRGAVMVQNLADVLKINEKMAMDGEHSEYMMVCICLSVLDAEEKMAVVKVADKQKTKRKDEDKG